MKIQYRNKVSNGAIFRFSPDDEQTVRETLSNNGLSLSPTNRIVYTDFSEVRATVRVGDIDSAIQAVGATSIPDEE